MILRVEADCPNCGFCHIFPADAPQGIRIILCEAETKGCGNKFVVFFMVVVQEGVLSVQAHCSPISNDEASKAIHVQ